MNTHQPHYNVSELGQVFTPDYLVKVMLSLKTNTGRVLEPSCGDGAFFKEIPGCVGIEYDCRHAPPGSQVMDFFEYPTSEQFRTIIGNPPYVRFRDIPQSTRKLIAQRCQWRMNLYLHFIEKSLHHLQHGGELIFVTPRDFLKQTSCLEFNTWLFDQGSITDVIDLGDSRVFETASPNCMVWRFEKGNHSRQVNYSELSRCTDPATALTSISWQCRKFTNINGYLAFDAQQHAHSVLLGDIAEVKVGAVSAADDIFANELLGNLDFVSAATRRTGKTRRMIWSNDDHAPPASLLPHKTKLISRKMRKFDETNWWKWGRGYPRNTGPRIYVNGKTRQHSPFFIHDCENFDGAVLAIFPRDAAVDLQELCRCLNSVNWQALGFMCDGRYLFSQRSLINAPLPQEFLKFLPKTLTTTSH